MRPAMNVIGTTIREWYVNMLGLVILNLLWTVLSLTVVLLPPATAGIYAVTHQVAHGTGGRINDFVEGARRYVWLSLRWALLNLLVGIVLAANFVFYGSLHNAPGAAMQVLTGLMALVWAGTQLYVWPFLYEQEEKKLRQALKNAVFLALAAPLYTLSLLAALALAAVISAVTLLPVAIFITSFAALLGSRAVIERLTAYGRLPQANQTTT